MLLGSSTLLGGCDALDAIAAGQCGNGVVEPSYQEDCDCYDETGESGYCERKVQGAGGEEVTVSCILPGQPLQCRYACGASGQQCPDGWGCGIDKVCHAPTGQFEPLGPTITLDSTELRCADFDGDGRDDVMGVGSSKLDVLFYDPNGTLGAHQEILSFGDVPAIGQLTEEIDEVTPRADFVFSVGPGMAVLTGQANRTFKPVAIPSATFEMEDAIEPTDNMNGARFLSQNTANGADMAPRYAVVWGIRPDDNNDDNEPEDFYNLIRWPAPAGADNDEWTKGVQLASLAGPPATGNLDGSPEDEVVIAVKDEKVAHVYAPYTAGNDARIQVGLSRASEHSEIEGGPFLQDVNGDGRLDLLLVVNTCESAVCLSLELAYGKGDGHFTSSLSGGEDDTTAPYASLSDSSVQGEQALEAALPIALGDINGDGLLDVVDSNTIKIAAPPPAATDLIVFEERFRVVDKRWNEAVIRDVNGDGLGDVVAGSSSASDLTFLGGAGKGPLTSGGGAAGGGEVDRFNEFTIPTRGGVSALTVGDFDGDSLPDVAFAERSGGLLDTTQSRTLSICFGRFRQPPEAPVRMGDYDGLFDVEKVKLPRGADQAVAVDDLALSYLEGQSVAISRIRGNGARQLIPSFLLMATETANPMAAQLIDRPLQGFAGSYTRDPDFTDVVIFGLNTTQPMPPVGVDTQPQWGSLWLLETDDDGELSLPDGTLRPRPLHKLPPDEDLYWTISGLSVDLDNSEPPTGKKRDELVVSWAKRADDAGRDFYGAIAVLREDTLNGSRTLTEPSDENTRADSEMELYSQLAAIDLDGDKFKDIVAIAYTLSDDLDHATESKVVVFWNSGDGQLTPYTELTPVNECLKSPDRCGAAPEAATPDEGVWSVKSIAVANVTYSPVVMDRGDLGAQQEVVPDSEEELIVLTEGGMFLVEPCSGGTRCKDDSGVMKLEVSPMPRLGGGSRVMACDIAGDGVVDLAILQNNSLRILNGVPAIR